MSGTWSLQEAYGSAPPAAPPPAPPLAGGPSTPNTWSLGEAYGPAPQTPATPSGAPAQTGIVANMGARVNDQAAGIAGLPIDLMTGAENLGLRGGHAAQMWADRNLPGAGAVDDWLGRHTGGWLGNTSAQQSANAPSPQVGPLLGGSASIKSGLGLVGADPRNVVPANDLERYAGAAAGGLAGMLLPGGIAKALPELAGAAGAVQTGLEAGLTPTGLAAGAAGGVTGQGAQDAVSDPYKPLAGLAGNLLGGGLVAGGVAGGKAAAAPVVERVGNLVRPIRGAAGPILGADGKPILLSDITGQDTDAFPVMAKPGQVQMAGSTLRDRASDPVAAQAALSDIKPGVPGVNPTTYQATNDPGLGQLERQAATNNPGLFIARQEQQNAARVAATRAIPAPGDVQAVPELFQQQLRTLDAQAATEQQTGLAAAQTAAQGLGGSTVGTDAQSALQAHGEALRGPLADTAGASKAGYKALYKAVDPDGKLAVDMQPIKATATDIGTNLSPNAAPLAGDEAAIIMRARLMPAVQPFADLGAFRSRITTALSVARQDPAQAQTVGRLSQLLGSVHDAMDSTIAGQASRDAEAVAAGQMHPDDGIVSRLQAATSDDRQQFSGGSAGAFPVGRAVGAGDPGSPGAPASGPAASFPRVDGTASAAFGRSGYAAGNSGLSPAIKPQSLLSFLVARGGLIDEGGDLAAMGLNNRTRPTLIRSNGKTLDNAREAAIEAGFLPKDDPLNPNVSDINMLLDHISEEASGRKIYRPGDGAEYMIGRAERDAMDAHEERMSNARSDVERYADDMGISAGRSAVLNHATELVGHVGMHPQDALENALTADQHAQRDLETKRLAMGPQDGIPLAHQDSMPLGGGSKLQPNFDAAAAGRYRDANAAFATHQATFGARAPGVGPVLTPGPTAGTFRTAPSQVPAILFRGTGAAERVRAYFKAGGSREAAQDYLASDLRRSAENADGTIDPGKLQRWQAAHAETMHAFPDLAARFNSAGAARQAMTGAATRAQAAQDAFTASAVKPFLGDGDPVAAVGRILEGDRRLPMMQELAQRTAGNPDARAGLQQAAIKYLLSKATSNSDLLKSDVFQTFVKKTPAALAQIFSPKQIEALQGVAESLKEANRSIVGTKIAGQSNTAQDLANGGGHGVSKKMLYQMAVVEGLGGYIGEMMGHAMGGHGLVGAAAGAMSTAASVGGAAALSAMRDAGIERVQQLAELAALHPPLARTLLANAPTSAKAGIIPLFRAQLAALTAASKPSFIEQPGQQVAGSR